MAGEASERGEGSFGGASGVGVAREEVGRGSSARGKGKLVACK